MKRITELVEQISELAEDLYNKKPDELFVLKEVTVTPTIQIDENGVETIVYDTTAGFILKTKILKYTKELENEINK